MASSDGEGEGGAMKEGAGDRGHGTSSECGMIFRAGVCVGVWRGSGYTRRKGANTDVEVTVVQEFTNGWYNSTEWKSER